ncbi:diguanylate cyclase domain-containing protein [Clostridium sp.]|uniref:sensor domain-containing diguanylate cyclase n=1 Tax=Clostridium sp. TaxID=1506 RepID=UPI00283C6B89|nr:diguanylate cyclase [Clostridium sp.]MDR3598448.1 diguanylate cyclase [Clostridium sp.]
MNKVLYDILNSVNEGIVILDEQLDVCIWNKYTEDITHIDSKKAVGKKIYDLLPNLNKNYFNKAINDVLVKGCKMFFSAAMHKDLISDKGNFNIKISTFESDNSKFLLLEFIDVTNQFIQINILKNNIQKLHKVNMELKEKESIIKKLAYYDKLTDVANRTLFYELSEKFLANAKRENSLLGLMFIDVNKFKNINDTYGHEAGDNVLVNVAKTLADSVRKNDIIARYGGDEFLILLPNIKKHDNYKRIVSRITNSKNRKISINSEEVNISLSIGVSFYPNDGDSIDKLIIEADKAMYIAKKRTGKDCSACSLLQNK